MGGQKFRGAQKYSFSWYSFYLTNNYTYSLLTASMKCVFYYIWAFIAYYNIFGVYVRVLGQESQPYTYCLGVTLQGQN